MTAQKTRTGLTFKNTDDVRARLAAMGVTVLTVDTVKTTHCDGCPCCCGEWYSLDTPRFRVVGGTRKALRAAGLRCLRTV
jgi:hypothetical protein